MKAETLNCDCILKDSFNLRSKKVIWKSCEPNRLKVTVQIDIVFSNRGFGGFKHLVQNCCNLVMLFKQVHTKNNPHEKILYYTYIL